MEYAKMDCREIVGQSDGLPMTRKSLTIRVHGGPRPCGSCATNRLTSTWWYRANSRHRSTI